MIPEAGPAAVSRSSEKRIFALVNQNDTHLGCLIFKPSPSVDEVVKMESVCLHMVTACETVR